LLAVAVVAVPLFIGQHVEVEVVQALIEQAQTYL
jgi:hypothetical protein